MSGNESGRTRGAEGDAFSLDRDVIRAAVSQQLFGRGRAPIMGRYELVRRVGVGGMGFVFEAIELGSDRRVALKVLRRDLAGALGRLKREFRAICALYHPNLVQFHELVLEAPEPFLTMEFVAGQSWLEYVRPAGALDLDRLRETTRQLIDAVSTLHSTGVLHRDLKPSNVRVEPRGRLVVLDFGLSREVSDLDAASATTSGTLRYMAPERSRRDAEGPASDWYSVGVMLRDVIDEALAEAADPYLVELGRLCQRMLHDEPAARPAAAELREWVGLPRGAAPITALRTAAPDGLFVGREEELERLDAALSQSRALGCVVVHVRGEPGIGKTSLVKRAIERFRARGPITVLRSRCYERESIAYNAIDGLIDALAGELEGMPSQAREALRPKDAEELVRLFPAAARALGGEPSGTPASRQHDPQRARERACDALRSLLGALAQRRSLLVHLDDLQWGDADSALILRALLEDNPPAMLLIASYRTADADRSPAIRALRGAPARGASCEHEVALSPLAEPAALALGRALASAAIEDDVLAGLVASAGGNPLFVGMLARHGIQARVDVAGRVDSLQVLLTEVFAQLPAASRTLLALCALANRPLESTLLLEVARGAGEENCWPEHLSLLQGAGLIRSVPSLQTRGFESFHDRVREVVEATASRELACKVHLALARTPAFADDPEFLALHYEAAGASAIAAEHAEHAGDRALGAVALERAAQSYEQALRCRNGDRPQALVRKLADVKACTAHRVEAAQLYLELANSSELLPALRLRLLAGDMLLRAGRMREHDEVIEPVLRAVGLRYPRLGQAHRFWSLCTLVRLRLRLRMRRALPAPVRRHSTPREHLRADVCFRLGSSYSTVDPNLGAPFLMRGISLALDSGDPAQLAPALALYALLLARLGLAGPPEQDHWHERALHMAEQTGNAETKEGVLYLRAITAHLATRFSLSLRSLERTQEWISTHCPDSVITEDLETGTCVALGLMSRTSELDQRSRIALRRATERGNEFDAALLRCVRVFAWLASDDPATAISEMDDVSRIWSQTGPSTVSFNARIAAITTKQYALLYAGDSVASWRLLAESRPLFARGRHHTVQPYAALLSMLQGTTALACVQARPRPEYLRAVDRSIRVLQRMRAPLAIPSYRMLAAGRAQLAGLPQRACELYAEAAAAYQAQDLSGHAACADMRRGELLGGDAGQALEARALAWFQAQSIQRPERWIRMYAPVTTRATARVRAVR